MSGTDPATTSYPEIRERIDSGPVVFNQYLIIFVCFLLNVADGFDLLAMSMAAPSISADWEIDPKALGVIFSAALAGMIIGSMFLAPLSDRIGRRAIILCAMAAVSLSMFATAYSTSVIQLIPIRFVTGLSIGGVLASVTSLAAEFAPAHRRSLAVIFVHSGYAAGAIIVGPIASTVIGAQGWERLFVYGGIISGVLFFLSILLVPESIELLAAKSGNDEKRLARINGIMSRIGKPVFEELPVCSNESAPPSGSIKSLLNPVYRARTLRLWTVFFVALWANFFLATWIPKLFVDAGFDSKVGIFALTVYSVSALVGALSLGAMSVKFDLTRTIALMFLASAVLLGIYTLAKPEDIFLLYAFWACIGFGLGGGFSGLFAVAAQVYPAEIRATGVGWSIGLGRFGALISPVVAGYLVAVGWGMYGLFLVMAIPAMTVAGILIKGVRN